MKLFKRCEHLRTRCLHGDEIWARMTVYTLRFWKDNVINRQLCLDCGKPLNREAICTLTGYDVHNQYAGIVAIEHGFYRCKQLGY